MENIRKQFETNFFGAVELTQLILPTMCKQGFGRIVNVSSIGGDLYMPLGAFYSATKAALQQWSDALDMEVSEFGIRSVIVQLGGTQSSWGQIAMDNAKKNLVENSPYLPLTEHIRATLNGAASDNGPTAADLAQVFYKASTDEKLKHRYFNAFGDRLAVHVARSHPRLLKKIMNITLKQLAKRTNK